MRRPRCACKCEGVWTVGQMCGLNKESEMRLGAGQVRVACMRL